MTELGNLINPDLCHMPDLCMMLLPECGGLLVSWPLNEGHLTFLIKNKLQLLPI